MRFKICAFNKPAYAENIESLISQLRINYLCSSVSVKYVNQSGLVAVVFVDVSIDGQCRDSYSNQPIDFQALDILAAVEFELDVVV